MVLGTVRGENPVMNHSTLLVKFAGLGVALLLLAACASSRNGNAEGEMAPGTGEVLPGSVQDLVVNVGDRVYFDLDRYNLKPSAQATLERQAAWLKTYSNVTITVEGHCDERGTREYNLALGSRRANAVKDYLVSLGIAPNRITTISYGKERPAVLGSTEDAWAQNRRGVTVVTGGAAS